MPLTKEQVQKMIDEHREKAKKDPGSAWDSLATNAKLLPNHFPAVSGKAAIESHHKEKASKLADMEFKQTVEEVVNEGDICIVDGTMVISKGGKELDSGKFLSVLKKEGDSYKLLRTMNNSSLAMPGMCS